jgi:hypothetical protein
MVYDPENLVEDQDLLFLLHLERLKDKIMQVASDDEHLATGHREED